MFFKALVVVIGFCFFVCPLYAQTIEERECTRATEAIPDSTCKVCKECVVIVGRAGDKMCKKCNELQCDLKPCGECSDQECVKG